MDTVPSRIVLMGTSKMSLHDRFSKIPRPTRTLPVKNHLTGYRSAEHDYREDVEAKPVVYDNNDVMTAGYMYTDALLNGDVYPVEYRMVRPRQRYVRLPSSLRSRVNFPVRRQTASYFQPSRGISRRAFFFKPKPRVFRSVDASGNVQNNGRFGKLNQISGGFRPKRNMNFSRGKGVRSRGGSGNKFKREPVTREDLDKELDAYMKKGKHPQIDVSDLV